jgi:hypothetical protein
MLTALWLVLADGEPMESLADGRGVGDSDAGFVCYLSKADAERSVADYRDQRDRRGMDEDDRRISVVRYARDLRTETVL